MSRTKPQLPSDSSPCPLPTPTSTNSFWHSQPSPLLTAHRSTRNLPEQADVVIIGSGMTGASVAHHLLKDAWASKNATWKGKQKPLSVVMLEAREACWGATGRNGGHCQPLLLEHPSDPSIPAFELENFHALDLLRKTKNIDCEFVPQPGVRAIYSLSNLHSTELALHTLQSTSPEMAKLTRITRDENELAALRVPSALGAVVTETAARMWPYKLVAHILEELLTADELAGGTSGGTFNLQTLTPVEKLTRGTSGSEWQVQTARGTITASKVVLATNAYTSHLLPQLSDLIVPVRGQMSALRPLPSVSGPNRLKTSFGFAGDGIDDYLIQRPNESGGHLMFGGGRQMKSCVGVADDSEIDSRTAGYLRTRLVDALALPEKLQNENVEYQAQVACEYCRRRRIRCSGRNPNDPRCFNCVRFNQTAASCGPFSPHAVQRRPTNFQASHEWTGIMGFSRDELPWVGPVPSSLISQAETSPNEKDDADATGLFIAAGFTGHGMPNTWLCGRAVAEMVAGDGASGVETAVRNTGLPKAYLISEERVERARELQSVEAKDWAEMERGERRMRADRPSSGYA